MEDLGRLPQSLAERRRADRHDHEFLRVDGVRRVRAAVQDIHHRHGQVMAGEAAEEAVERHALRRCRRFCRRERDGEDGVRAELRLVLRAVEREHHAVDGVDVGGVLATECGRDDLVDILHGAAHALAAVFRLVAVAQLVGLELARRGAGGHRRPADSPRGQRHLRLDRRIAARVDDLSANYIDDAQIASHSICLLSAALTACFARSANGVGGTRGRVDLASRRCFRASLYASNIT